MRIQLALLWIIARCLVAGLEAGPLKTAMMGRLVEIKGDLDLASDL